MKRRSGGARCARLGKYRKKPGTGGQSCSQDRVEPCGCAGPRLGHPFDELPEHTSAVPEHRQRNKLERVHEIGHAELRSSSRREVVDERSSQDRRGSGRRRLHDGLVSTGRECDDERVGQEPKPGLALRGELSFVSFSALTSVTDVGCSSNGPAGSSRCRPTGTLRAPAARTLGRWSRASRRARGRRARTQGSGGAAAGEPREPTLRAVGQGLVPRSRPNAGPPGHAGAAPRHSSGSAWTLAEVVTRRA